MSLKLLAIYFLLGGLVVSLSVYIGHIGKGAFAAFISLFPSITLLTLCLVYLDKGSVEAGSYLRHLLYFIPAWLGYIIPTIFLLPKIGLVPSLIIGVVLYTVITLITLKIVS